MRRCGGAGRIWGQRSGGGGAITYVGKESPAGAWLVQRIDATSGLVVRYASVVTTQARGDELCGGLGGRAG